MKKYAWLAVTGCILLLLALAPVVAGAKGGIELSPPKKVGAHTVRIAFKPTSLEWLVEQQYFVIDGKNVPLPPLSLGYDRTFSSPHWMVRGREIVGLKYWQFDKAKSQRRAMHLSFPDYRVISRGPWAFSPGSDTVPDPPK